MKARSLTSHQRQELEAHLREKLGERCDGAMRQISVAYRWASAELENGPWLEERAKVERSKFRKHFEKTAKRARELKGLLEWQSPNDQRIEWSGLKEALELLSESASKDASAERRPRAPPKSTVWRDSLISVVAGVYPRRAKGDHFSTTVAMLLENLRGAGHQIEDEVPDLRRTIQLAVKKPIAPVLRALLGAK